VRKLDYIPHYQIWREARCRRHVTGRFSHYGMKLAAGATWQGNSLVSHLSGVEMRVFC
jgi:hypothetical protein